MNNHQLEQYRIPVPSEFKNILSHFYFAENKSNERITQKLMPTFQTIMVFLFGDDVTLSNQENTNLSIEKCVVLGPIKKPLTYSLSPESSILVANFRGDAFYRFFETASINQALPINPDELFAENCFTLLWKNLSLLQNTEERVSLVLDFCRPYLKPTNKIAEQLSNFDHDNLSAIKVVAKENNQSERNIQLKHQKYFGYSSKEITRYQRFIKTIDFIQKETSNDQKIDWFDIITQCGYYDQSQLIHDFQHFLNLSPTKYLKFQESICSS